MKAAVLNAFGSPLAIETVPEPLLGTGEVIVDVAASRVLAYANEVLSGERKYLLELPIVPGPGAIGRIRATGPDATRLRPGDWVYCDPTVRSRDNALSPDIALQGLTAGSEGGLRLQRYFHDGAWAEQMRLPTENAVPIGDIDEKDAGRWCALGTLLVPYGGFLAAHLQAGEIALVNGATGSFGSAAVAVRWDGRAVRRRDRAERASAERTGAAVRCPRRTVPMRGHEADDRARILQAAPGPIDCVLDILPPAANAVQVRTAVMAVRPYGRVVLMGGVGMLGGAGLELPYPG
jgi:alcohol dehydrogenase